MTAELAQIRNEKKSTKASQSIMHGLLANELIFGVVGPVGSGTSEIAKALEVLLKGKGYQQARILKARDVILEWAKANDEVIPNGEGLLLSQALQNAGDEMRSKSKDNAAVARGLALKIRETRADFTGQRVRSGESVPPDGVKRVFILDSLRHPFEVMLLRRLYQNAFCLIAVVCHESVRLERLAGDKYKSSSRDDIEKFMRRDENAPEKYGQKVSDTFHLADFFVDNTVARFITDSGQTFENRDWDVNDQLGRLVDILSNSRVIRPRANETGMYHAFGARMRSSCLSRQVGASLMDKDGNIVATGTNEVPRAGGGVYGGGTYEDVNKDPSLDRDHRCFVNKKVCSNVVEQNNIVKELFTTVEEFKGINLTDELISRIRKTRIGQLIEFSRAVHAEMDAIMSAARQGTSSLGTRMFVSTFPCHNCARHLVAAGVDEVQYIEPYLKSKAVELHPDSIQTNSLGWNPPSRIKGEASKKVLFRPFVGVAPRLYRRAFYKDMELKDSFSGKLLETFEAPEGYSIPQPLRVSYAEVEARLSQESSIEEATP